MTVAPHRSPQVRSAMVLGFVVLDLALAFVVLREFGAGPAFFLFALAGVGIVDLVLLSRRRAGPARTD